MPTQIQSAPVRPPGPHRIVYIRVVNGRNTRPSSGHSRTSPKAAATDAWAGRSSRSQTRAAEPAPPGWRTDTCGHSLNRCGSQRYSTRRSDDRASPDLGDSPSARTGSESARAGQRPAREVRAPTIGGGRSHAESATMTAIHARLGQRRRRPRCRRRPPVGRPCRRPWPRRCGSRGLADPRSPGSSARQPGLGRGGPDGAPADGRQRRGRLAARAARDGSARRPDRRDDLAGRRRPTRPAGAAGAAGADSRRPRRAPSRPMGRTRRSRAR